MNTEVFEGAVLRSGPPGGTRYLRSSLLLNCNIKIESRSGCVANGVCREVAAVVKWPLRTSPHS